MSYTLRSVLKDSKLWEELKKEQNALDVEFGVDPSNEKRSSMKLLYKTLMSEMFVNTFPFLLRYTDEPYNIDGNLYRLIIM